MASDSGQDSGHSSISRRNTFSQTCSLLSRYLKEKGSVEELTLALNQTSDFKDGDRFETIDFLPLIERSAPMEPSAAGCGSGSAGEMLRPCTAQMTIFYAGHVTVIDDLSESTAREILEMATRTNAAVPRARSPESTSLPVARRRSIAHFLEKRKESRSISNAQMHGGGDHYRRK